MFEVLSRCRPRRKKRSHVNLSLALRTEIWKHYLKNMKQKCYKIDPRGANSYICVGIKV
jgi:hypothetical protein